MTKKKFKLVRNPATRKVIVFATLVVALIVGVSLLPFRGAVMVGILWVGGIALGIVLALFLLIMLISLIGSIRYWIIKGYWYNPWAMSPWGYGPYGGRHDEDPGRYDERS